MGSEKSLAIKQEGVGFNALLDPEKFGQLYKLAEVFAKTDMVPEWYKRKPENCLVSMQMAMRLDIDPLMFLQQSYIVHGKPGISAQLAIALINSSGLFTGPLKFELSGSGKGRKCVASATRKSGQLCEAECSIEIAEKEGWMRKNGSKWQTMPDLMLQYRSASFFARLYCPERLVGMQTVEEINDIVAVEEVSKKSLIDTIQEAEPEQQQVIEAVEVVEEQTPETNNNESPEDEHPGQQFINDVLTYCCGDIESAEQLCQELTFYKPPKAREGRGLTSSECLEANPNRIKIAQGKLQDLIDKDNDAWGDGNGE